METNKGFCFYCGQEGYVVECDGCGEITCTLCINEEDDGNWCDDCFEE